MEWQGVIGLKESWNEIKDANINEEFFGRGRTPHHKEHISGEWETLAVANFDYIEGVDAATVEVSI